MGEVLRAWNASGATPVALRSQAEFAGFFHALALVEPGAVTLPHWRPDPDTRYTDREVLFSCGAGRKP
jgi:hypothetical protein